MDSAIAKHVMRSVFRSARELEGLIPLLKDHCETEEYGALSKAIGLTLATMSTELTEKVLAAHPELSQEIDADIAKYGRYL